MKRPFAKPSKYVVKITARQKQFAEAYVATQDARLAAKQAGYQSTAAGAAALKQKTVLDYIATLAKPLQKALQKKVIATFDQKIDRLWEIAQGGADRDAISAIAELSKMQGHYAAEKHIGLEIHAKADADIKRVSDEMQRALEQYKSEY